ncbi:MAG: DUF4380 domain-containing protein [Parabacteroides sp.]|nr:DUF4380 domain-containing protein [Parabacteroides sp.]
MSRIATMFVLCVFSFFSCGNRRDQIASITSGDGWYEMSFSDISVTISSEKGGRIISYMCNGKELLLPSSVHEENYGATLWPSPQKDWGWPPYPTLDIGTYKPLVTGDTLYLESDVDLLSGYSFRKAFYISTSDTSLVIDYYIHNCSDEIKKVAAWDVCRIKGGVSFFPLDDYGYFDNSSLKGITKYGNILVYKCDTTLLDTPQKLFSSASGGWMANYTDGLLFVKQFPDISIDDIPPMQGEVEIFAQEKGLYIELENHGKFTTLNPGENLCYHEKWFLRDIGNDYIFKDILHKVFYIIK